MLRRRTGRSPALLLSLLASLSLCSPAKAHRLEADYRVLPGQRIAIESWFDLTGESPAEATVCVYRQAGDSLLAQGKADDKGLFVFTFSQVEPLRIVVSAPGGHRKELEIPATELTPAPAASSSSDSSSPAQDVRPFADRSTRISVKDVLLGLALLLALAAFALALRNARKLQAFRQNDSEKS